MYTIVHFYFLVAALGSLSSSPVAPSGGSTAPGLFQIDCPENTLDLLFDTFGAGTDNPRPFDPGFSPAYLYKVDQPLETAEYTIAHRSDGWASAGENWLSVGDQDGNPESYIALYNGAQTPGNVWEQQLGVCPGVEVEFSVDVLNLTDPAASPAALPDLDLVLDGVVVAGLGAIPQDGQWQTYTFTFTVPDASSAFLALQNNTTDTLGNDFAIDNLILQTCGPTLSAAELNPQPHCVGDTIQLQATIGSGFPNPVYRWQVSTNGGLNFIDFGDPTDQPLFTVDDLPPNARFRALASPTSDNLFNGGCVVFSEPVVIDYRSIEECSEVIVSVGDLCDGELGDNIVPDGDFGSGAANVVQEDPQFAPGYTYQPNPPPNDGFYTITNNTGPWGDFAIDWLDFGDNSDDPNGYMMVVNATFDQTDLFFERTVSVCENTTYQFSVDLINVQPEGNNFILPNVAFMINEQTLFNSGDVPEGGVWQTYGFSFTTGPGVTELQLGLRNNAPGGLGNDFAMDNISFRPCGPALIASEMNPVAHCPGDVLELTLDISPGFDDPIIQWQASTDEGSTWTNQGSATFQPSLTVSAVPFNARYRALVADSPANLDSPNCRIISNEVVPPFQPIEACVDSPIDVIGDLCQGVLGMPLIEGGNFGGGEDAFGPAITGDTTTLSYAGVDTFPAPGQYVRAQSFRDDPCQGAFPDTCWIPIQRDTTDSTSYRMIINADGDPDIFFKAEATDLCENTIYQFSAEVLNLSAPFFYPNNPDGTDTVGLPNIDLIVAPTGTSRELLQAMPATFNSGDIPNDTIRRTIGFTFEMKPGETDILIAVRNNGPDGFGNDLVLDNVMVAVCGPPSVVEYDPVCPGESITLNAVINGDQFPNPAIQWIESLDGGMSWAEVPGATNRTLPRPDPVPGALYSFLIAADAEKLQNPNCRVNADLNVIEFLPESLTLIDTSICEGETIQVGNNTYGATGAYTETLSTTQGCDSIVQLELLVLEPVTTAIADTICEGESVSIGGNTFTESGQYAVSFTAASGCDSIVQLALTVTPAAETDLSTSICPGESVTVGDNTYSEAGSYVDTLTAQSGCDSIVRLELTVQEEVITETEVGLCPGESYQGLRPSSDTTLIDTLVTTSGCDSIHITRIRLSALADFAISGDTTICAGSSTVLDAGMQASYQWSTGATAQTIEVSAAGNYSVTVTDAFGCLAEDAVVVSVAELQAAVVTESPSCPGDKNGRVLITEVTGASGTVEYAIGGGAFQAEPAFTGLAPGNYAIRVRDARGCTYEEQVTVKPAEELLLSILPVSPIQPGDTIQLQVEVNRPVAVATWEPTTGLSCSDCLEPLAAPPVTTPYRLSVVDTAGCEDVAFVRVTVEDEPPLFAPNAFSPNDDGINDRFTLYGNQQVQRIDRLLIFDRWGELIFELNGLDVNDEQAGWDGTCRGQECPSGVYVFYAEITLTNGREESVKGDVVLIR